MMDQYTTYRRAHMAHLAYDSLNWHLNVLRKSAPKPFRVQFESLRVASCEANKLFLFYC